MNITHTTKTIRITFKMISFFFKGTSKPNQYIASQGMRLFTK